MELKATSNDRVIFTSLKPMSEAPTSIQVLFYDANGNGFIGATVDANYVMCGGGGVFSAGQFVGWHYVPKFRPGWMEK
jgi:hypothetical protein